MASSTRIDELKKKFDENPRRYFAPLANEFRKAGDIEQAIVICEEFLPQQPGHMSGHIVYGQALYEAGRMPESRTVFETALGLDPENLIALRHLGDIAQLQGDTPSARVWYRRVLDADPRNEEMQALIAALPPESAAADVPIIAEDDFDLAATFAEPATEAVGVRSMEIEKEEPPLQPAEQELEDTQPLGMPAVASAPTPTPPPIPSPELIDGFSLHGFETSHQPDAADVAHATADGLESTSFEPPTETIPVAHDLDDSLDSGVPSFEAPTQVIAALDGLQGSGEEPHPADEDEITQRFPAAQRPGEETTASAGSDVELLDFEMPATPASEAEPDAAMSEEERRDEDAPPVELPPSVIAAEADLIDAGETPAPTYATEAEMDAEAASAAPAPFVTETMAELYVAQGFREEALAVYLQLLAANPADERLQGKVASLAPVQPAQESQLTAREFFARMASRRPGMRGAAAIPPTDDDFAPAEAFAEPEPELVAEFVELDLVEVELETPAPPPVPESTASDVAPAIERAAAMRTPTGSLDALFGNRPPHTSEDSAASALAQAFGATVEAEPQIVGRPARAAAAELSLDSVFRDGPARPPRTSQSFSFDQFFTGGAAAGGSADSSSTTPASQTASDTAPPADTPAERSADDVSQFNSWLQGLKPR